PNRAPAYQDLRFVKPREGDLRRSLRDTRPCLPWRSSRRTSSPTRCLALSAPPDAPAASLPVSPRGRMSTTPAAVLARDCLFRKRSACFLWGRSTLQLLNPQARVDRVAQAITQEIAGQR